MKAIWNNIVIAESNETIVVEGNHYFPPSSIKPDYFQPSTHTTFCPWKGTSSYYNLSGNGHENKNVAWYYPDPKAAAKEIKDYVAFYPVVQVSNA